MNGPSRRRLFAQAAVLALGAAVSLGLSRFSYALLLPPMREDLGWSWLAGGMLHTFNAAGYLAGVFGAVAALDRGPARRLFLAGLLWSAAFLVAHGYFTLGPHLAVLRFASGMAAAATFVAGGLLAARLASTASGSTPPSAATQVLGIYYGGTGVGIVVSTAVVPPLAARPVAHAWQDAWIVLGACALAATVVVAWATRSAEPSSPEALPGDAPLSLRRFAPALASYFGFGLGYIGYMTFVVALLREAHVDDATVHVFYALLGVAVVASSWLWAGLLQRSRGGGAMAILNALLAAATVLPLVGTGVVAVFASGLLFGGVFLSVVASTTAFVRHNLSPPQWGRGIAAFTGAFAAGQIVGPSIVGWVSDAAGGLRAGFVVSAALLAAAAMAASLQRPLAARQDTP